MGIYRGSFILLKKLNMRVSFLASSISFVPIYEVESKIVVVVDKILTCTLKIKV